MEEDERRENAARKLQAAYRVRMARQALRRLVKDNYVKLYDRVNDQYVYKNKKTKEVFLKKPQFLGSDDLPTPKIYAAPTDYDPKDDFDTEGYALIVTVNSFPNGRIQELNPAVNIDHTQLEEVLSHDFICKIRLENVVSLRNPTCAQFKSALDDCRKLCKSRGFLVVYLCTHVVTVFKGEKENPKESSYFLMSDTIWTRPDLIAKTSISLSTFSSYINRIVCKRKTIFVNYSHNDRPKRSLFRSKEMYPAEDFLPRLVTETNCVVMACCTSGTPAYDIIKHTPQRLDVTVDERIEFLRKIRDDDSSMATLDTMSVGSTVKAVALDAPTSSWNCLKSSAVTPPTSGKIAAELDSLNVKAFPVATRTAAGPSGSGGGGVDITSRLMSADGAANHKGDNESETAVDEAIYRGSPLYEQMHSRFMAEWQIKPEKPIVISVRPPKLMATWQKDAETFYDVKIVLPTEKEVREFC